VLRPAAFDERGDAHGLAVSRYRAKPIPAVATVAGDRLAVRLSEAAPVVSPGQLLVFYDRSGDDVVCSGIIEG